MKTIYREGEVIFIINLTVPALPPEELANESGDYSFYITPQDVMVNGENL